jgi:polyhydroxybutyrate depolymerase
LGRRHRLLVLCALAGLVASCAADDDPDVATTTTEATTTTAGSTAAAPGEVASAEPVPSAGCGASTATAVDLERRTLAGSDRWYLITVPPAHDGATPLPLVLDFHGLSEGAELHARVSGMGPYAAEHGFIAVHPHGTGTPVHWDVAPDRAGNADLVFVDQLLDELEADLCVDTSRVYSTGLSNGALLSSTIACTMADRVAAVAPVAGVSHPEPCTPARPVPVLAFHGTADPILLFNGGVGTRLGRVLGGEDAPAEEEPIPEADLDGAGFPAAAASWAGTNGCGAAPTASTPTPSVIVHTWDCPAGADVEFVILVGGGHSWPGSALLQGAEQIVGPTDMSVDATDMMWRFFQRFAAPQVG